MLTPAETQTPWYVRFERPEATLRLVCYAYAGGGASVYQKWRHLLPASVEVWSAQYPGRETRIRETPLQSVDALAKGAVEESGALFDEPFALFGHSLGACVAFEVASRLHDERDVQPVHVIVSGSRPPHVPASKDRAPMHTLSDEAFIDRLRDLGGTPAEILEDRAMMDLLLPILRADTKAAEQYQMPLSSTPSLACPVTVLGGKDDPFVSEEELRAWESLTHGPFRSRMLPGGHLFLQSRPSDVTDVIAETLL